MSLPPGFLDELRSRVSLAQVVGRKVIWDQRKSQQGRGDMWAPCPFHQEKTASFHVEDRKGFYYCFGCHAKGDAITFVKETENVSFIEAVRILAEEAGMQMPERDPRAAEKADRRTRLSEVMEEAVRFYRLQLKTAAGQSARSYLEGRGLGPEAQERWELGFAPADWRMLSEYLTGKGIAPDLIAAAGLTKVSDRGGAPYDVFRNRIMFPIRDAQGRAIAFGGRAMDPDDTAKYLNSPETELFDKGRQLYNLGPARKAAGRGDPLIVAEGYMDVIALSEAGFACCVAPLGTAVTEDQLRLLWRVDPEPVIALDGDVAGQRAALRVMDLALPMIEAGQSLRFCLMPEGQDPDDLLRAKGPQAMRDLLDRAQPMVTLLWQREVEGRSFDSPERRAALDRALGQTLSRIGDQSIRRHYEQALRDLKWQFFNPRRGAGNQRKGFAQGPALTGVADGVEGDRLHEALVLSLLIRHPELRADLEERVLELEFHEQAYARLAICVFRARAETEEDLRADLSAGPAAAALEMLDRTRHLRVVPALRSGDRATVENCLNEALAKLTARRGAEAELTEAMQEIADVTNDDVLTWRLAEASKARAAAERSRRETGKGYDRAANGVLLDRQEKDALDALLRKIAPGGASGEE
ncbi:DNA primase [Palleronia caenipelagi]|uniref:DNA primase n=1 Tax=Palleronia caenipelagi TaxID=2489174 RepID=A0A547Q5B3_9RHOB|nr:DNA primase [Palleronia caenipelagi]TRD21581.1 DNA primase [Palleronia caenipelagi]